MRLVMATVLTSNAYLHVVKVGYIKEETNENPIVEFIGLHPRMYLFTGLRLIRAHPCG